MTSVVEVAGGVVLGRAVDVRAEVRRRLPAEVVVDVRPVGLVDVEAPERCDPERVRSVGVAREIVGPRLIAGPQGALREVRCETQMSPRPNPGGAKLMPSV
jgi:hypothetical protein